MQNLVDVGRREESLRREGIFRYFLCSIYPFLYSCSRLQVTPEDRSRPFMAQNACFRVRYHLLGVSTIKNNAWGSKLPKNMIWKGGLNRHFKPNLLNFRIAITRKVLTRSARNLKGNFRCISGLRGWSSITKLLFKIAAAAILNFCTNSNNSAAD